jgi:glucose-1-phosphate cytidylyltransferase
MRAVILAGGLGTRLSEETEHRPKPMVDIGGRPILWHIMKTYAAHGVADFAVALGYKGDVIKEFFVNYHRLVSDLRIKVGDGSVIPVGQPDDLWTVDLVDTGLQTNTGGRLRRLAPLLEEDEFCLTYGDGVGNVDIRALIEFHRRSGKIATVTAVRPPARFGALELNGDMVESFAEKNQANEGWINGGFLVLNRRVFDYIAGDETNLERDVLEVLAREGQLVAFRHEGFWQPMDTLRDVRTLQALWDSGQAPWVVW